VASLQLAIWAIIIEIVVGISVGLLSAIRRYSLSDKLTTIVTAVASAVPVFVLGFVMQWLFAVKPNQWNWPEWARLRTSGIGPDSWTLFFIPTGEQWRYLILPAIALASVTTALLARMTRGSMLEVLRADYMRTARAKGLRERDVVLKHGLRNAMLPVVTLIGLDFGTAIGAAVLTETTFTWPGLGSQIAQSVGDRDLPVLLGLTLVVVLAYAFVNIVVDVSYAWFDPRIRLGKGENA
jgi:ABC-type dipeptide/oligopeptide/nickel transport system permease component